MGAVPLPAGFAGIQLDFIPGQDQLPQASQPVLFPETKAGEEARHAFGTAEAHFAGEMVLRLEEEEPEGQIPQHLAPAGGKDADIPQPESPLPPPQAAGGRGDIILPDQDIPGLSVQRIPAGAENRLTDGKHLGQIGSLGEPFSLNHCIIHPLYTEKTMEKEKVERINELARKKKTGELTAEEQAEQEALRKEYIAGFRSNMQALLDNVVIQQLDGTRRKLEKKRP